MSGKKILVMIDWYLPGTKAGGPVRSVFSLLNLLRRDFQFFVLTSNRDLGSSETYTTVASNQWLEQDGVKYYYAEHTSFGEQKMLEIINGINPDLISLNSFWSYTFSILPVRLKVSGKINCPVLLSPRGMLGIGALSLKPIKKKLYIRISKLLSWYKEVSFHATNFQEEKDIRRFYPDAKISVVPNVNSAPPVENNAAKEPGHLKLFYLSRIARVKNLHFALECLRNAKGRIEYDIYGNAEDAVYIAECEKIIATLPDNIIIRFMGELSFDAVQATIRNYHALFLPTLNENFGHSIVESLRCGCLVLISDQTPWNSVNEEGVGFALTLAERDDFVNALNNLILLDNETFRKKSERAINYISKKIDTETIKLQYIKVFNERIKN